MDIFEVTNAMFAQCVEARVCTTPGCDYFGNSTYDDQPVVCVDWTQAQNYCEWRKARLPTEAEWEKAARGGASEKVYAWGDQKPDCSRANYYGCKGQQAAQVGSYPANGYGLFDMAGNVWEWVEDWYLENYYADSPSSNPHGPDNGGYRVSRGGSFFGNSYVLRIANRFRNGPNDVLDFLGFRCARSP